MCAQENNGSLNMNIQLLTGAVSAAGSVVNSIFRENSRNRAGIGRYIPEPRNSAGPTFRGVMNTVGNVMRSASSGFSGIDGDYVEIINQQIEAQQQLQLVSLHSNIEKSKHETRMAAVRNVRTA